MDADRADVERLRAYWDGLVQGDAPPPDGLDPATVAVVHQLRAWYRPLRPDPEFRIRLREELMDTAALSPRVPHHQSGLPSNHVGVNDNARAAARPWDQPPSLRARPDRGQRFGQLAAAAFVLLMLVASYAAFGKALRPRQQDIRLAAISAIEATPDSGSSSGVVQDTILFQQRIDAIPDGAGWTGIEHYTFAPGETWEQGKTRGAGLGPMHYRLAVGTMTVRAAAPFNLTRAGASAGAEVSQETPVVLAPGDVVFMPFGVASELRNDGTVPAQLLEAGIALTGTQAKAGDSYYDAYLSTWRPTPVDVTLRRRTLSPGGHVPAAAEPGLAYLGLEPASPEAQAGRLTIVWVDPATPTAASEEQQLNPPDPSGFSVMLTDLRHPGSYVAAQELRNDSNAAVTLLVWAITPVSEAAPDERPATSTT
jgi:hypothetical protein